MRRDAAPRGRGLTLSLSLSRALVKEATRRERMRGRGDTRGKEGERGGEGGRGFSTKLRAESF